MQLDDYLNDKRISGAAFGRLIGVARSTIYRYRKGQRMPRPAELGLIKQVTLGKVTPNDFVEGKSDGQRRKHR